MRLRVLLLVAWAVLMFGEVLVLRGAPATVWPWVGGVIAVQLAAGARIWRPWSGIEGAKRDVSHGVDRAEVERRGVEGTPMAGRLHLDGRWQRGVLVLGEGILRLWGQMWRGAGRCPATVSCWGQSGRRC
jgi:hypothetical protein